MLARQNVKIGRQGLDMEPTWKRKETWSPILVIVAREMLEDWFQPPTCRKQVCRHLLEKEHPSPGTTVRPSTGPRAKATAKSIMTNVVVRP